MAYIGGGGYTITLFHIGAREPATIIPTFHIFSTSYLQGANLYMLQEIRMIKIIGATA